MARKKQPTTPESSVEQILDAVANVAGRSEKTSWKRKLENMEKLMEKLQPIEDQLLELQAEKAPIIDEIAELREELLATQLENIELSAGITPSGTRKPLPGESKKDFVARSSKEARERAGDNNTGQ